jgi:hypothetical protein
MISLMEVCGLLDRSVIGTDIRESSLLFPIIEGVHVLALAFSVGLILITDLRLMGVVMRDRATSEIWSQFFPWMMSGFGIMFLTGSLLFWSHALSAYHSAAFRAKLVLLILSGLNAAIYHFTIYRKRDQWDTAPMPPIQARLAGWTSLILWAGVITMGRIMAYTF